MSKASGPARKAVLADLALEATEAARWARIAAATDDRKRVEAAIQTVRKLCNEEKESPGASITEANALLMNMPDGGFRPMHHVQLATAGSEDGGALHDRRAARRQRWQ